MAVYIGNQLVKPSGIKKIYVGNQLVYENAPAPTVNYFYITPNTAEGAEVKLVAMGSPNSIDLEYKLSTDSSWSTYTIGTSISLTYGTKLYFRGNNDHFSKDASNYYEFDTTSGYIDIGGDLTTLLSKNGNVLDISRYGSRLFNQLFRCQKTVQYPDRPNANVIDAHNLVLPSTTLCDYAYSNMFAGVTSGPGQTVVNAGFNLPALTIPSYGYNYMFSGASNLTTPPTIAATSVGQYGCKYMFNNCSSLVNAPTINITTLSTYCYSGMFQNCSNLVSAPTLPVTTLATYCYYQMFRYCTSLVNAPALPATTLVTQCYYQMFWGCTALMSMNVAFTTWPVNSPSSAPTYRATYQWVQGVDTSGGTFTCPSSLPLEYGVNKIPSGWQ